MKSKRRSCRRKHPAVHLLLLVVICGLLTSLGIAGASWWQDRPIRRIRELLSREQFDQALTAADRYLSHSPEDTRAQILKARSLAGLGRHLSADQLLQSVAIRSGGFPDDRDALQAWARSLLHLGYWERASAILRTLLTETPDDPDLLYPLTVSLIRQMQFDDALQAAGRLQQIEGFGLKASVIIGTICHDQGNSQRASEYWDQVLAENPEGEDLLVPPHELYAMAGEDYLESGSPERAVALLERSVALSPLARTYVLLGQAWLQTGDELKAVDCWNTAVSLDEHNVAAREELANAALRNNEPARAMEFVAPILKSGQLKSSTAYVMQRAYTQLRDPENAAVWRERVSVLREAEKTSTTLSDLLRNTSSPFWKAFLRAYRFAHQGQWENAEQIVGELMLQRPDDSLLRQLATAIRDHGPLPPLELFSARNP